MSGPYPKGKLSNKGATTPVNIGFPEIEGKDKDVLCAAVCECKEAPEVGKTGQSLRQVCVSKKLRKRDYVADFQSDYKAEVNYDMTKAPPVPIMNYEFKTKVHEWVPGWIKKRWDADPDHPMWLPGEGYIRRPDVIIVKDPTKPPTQDNIKQVVEIKFEKDPWGEGQAESYEIISGRGKLALLTPKMCSCDDPDRKKRTEDVKTEEQERHALKVLENLNNKGGGDGRGPKPKLPRKIPNLKD